MADWDTIQDMEIIPSNHRQHHKHHNHQHHNHNDHQQTATSKVDPKSETLPSAYANPAFRHSVGPIHVTSNRYSREKHLNENHLIFDKHPNSNSNNNSNNVNNNNNSNPHYITNDLRGFDNTGFLSDETDTRPPRRHGTVSVRRRVFRENPASRKYATHRLPGESVVLNPVNLPVTEERQQLLFIRKPRLGLSKLSNGAAGGGGGGGGTMALKDKNASPVLYRSATVPNPHLHPHRGVYTVGGGGGGLRGTSGTLRRFKSSSERIEDFVSFFDIETDKVEAYQYRPGEEVSGAIKIIVKKNFEIRYVELIVIGKGHLTLHLGKGRLPKTLKETYLYKQTYVIGTGDATWSSVLTSGNYTSKFRIKLPTSLPSSVHHDDVTNGFSYDVTYTMVARMCDESAQSSFRSTASRASGRHLRRVVLAKQATFVVQRAFDINTIPNGLEPVIHKEQIWLSCAHNSAAVVSVQLDRNVFLAGDDIRLSLTASLPGSQRVKDITCSLQEHLTFDQNSDPVTYTLSRMICKEPATLGQNHKLTSGDQVENTYDVTIPTQTNLISSFMVSNAIFKVTYSLAILFRFSNSGGKLSFKVPISIGPCADPIYAEKISSRKFVPVFNRPTRFPCFATSGSSGAAPDQTSNRLSARTSSSVSIPIETKYSNSIWSRFLLCCSASTSGD